MEGSSGAGSLVKFPSGGTSTDLQQEGCKDRRSPKLRSQDQVTCATNLTLIPLSWGSKVSACFLVPQCLMLGIILDFSAFLTAQDKILAWEMTLGYWSPLTDIVTDSPSPAHLNSFPGSSIVFFYPPVTAYFMELAPLKAARQDSKLLPPALCPPSAPPSAVPASSAFETSAPSSPCNAFVWNLTISPFFKLPATWPVSKLNSPSIFLVEFF